MIGEMARLRGNMGVNVKVNVQVHHVNVKVNYLQAIDGEGLEAQT